MAGRDLSNSKSQNAKSLTYPSADRKKDIVIQIKF